uniref:Uncharacterized protein n=1 Tax=Hemiselmis andersenii TaxID=464988 RepID=A0A6U4PCE9_HEMAN|mmetsp:Transcript_9377/g.21903  ORF Transcript_9377/g.21903 Transcript_9377/m.21903 type:complete len:953 (+) Transcript_9377:196-3054(+)
MGEEGGDGEKFGKPEDKVPEIDEVKRGCTDIFCFCLFLVMWIVWIILAIMAMTDGCPNNCNNPYKLVYGFDADGCMCNSDCTSTLGIDNTNKPNLYIPDPREPSVRLCLAACPSDWGFSKNLSTPVGTYRCGGGACNVAGKSEPEFFVQRTKGDVLSNDGMFDNCFLPGSNGTDCWYPTYPTQELLYKCVPMLPANMSEEQSATLAKMGMPVDTASFGGAMAFMSNPAGEIGTLTAEFTLTWPILLASALIAIVLGFVWMILIRLFAMVMLWVTCIGLFFLFGLVAVFAWDKTGKIEIFSTINAQTGQNVSALAESAGIPGAEATTEPALVEAVAWIFTVLFVVYFVLMFFFLKRIIIAVKVIREAAKAMSAMPMMVFQPVWTLSSLCLLYLWVGLITVYLVSAGEFDPSTGQFVYGGGTCTNLVDQGINVTTTATLITVSLAANVKLRHVESSNTDEYTVNGGNNWATHAFVFGNSSLRGTQCSADQITGLVRCTNASNTSSSPNLPIGTCLGDYLPGSNCSSMSPLASQVSSVGGAGGAGRQPGTIGWDATTGMITISVSDNTTIGSSFEATTLRLAARIDPCSDTGACTVWNLGPHPLVAGVGVDKMSFTVQTVDFFSVYNLTYPEVVRACNLYSTEALALDKLLQSKRTAMVKQGKVDLNELESSTWGTPTVENWKSFLPITLDGNSYQYICVYHLFMFLWVSNFTVSSGYFILAGSVATWYWTLDKKTLAKPITKSTYRYVRYHIGTVCVGSFIIAVVQLIRILFNYFVNRCKQFENNPLVKAIKCIVNCCLWCLEKIIGYINKNAYIMCATHGYYFCKAAFSGFMLLMRNIMRVAAVNVVAGVLLGVGKIFICLATLGICYLISVQMANDLGLTNGTPFLSLFVVTIIGWYVGASFMGTFEAAVDTIFLSFLHDQEVNNGKDKPYFMADSLQSSIGVSNSKVTPES